MTKNRVDWIDMAKAVAIISVVLGHVMYFPGLTKIQPWFLNDLLGLFQMPLFIVCSALVMSMNMLTTRGIFADIYKRFRQLLVPMFVVGFVFVQIIHVPITDFIFQTMKSGYWYLLTLFELYLLSYPFRMTTKLSKEKSITAIVDIAMGGVIIWIVRRCSLDELDAHTISNALSILQLKQYFPVFITFYLLKKYELVESFLSNEIIYAFSILLSVAILLLVYYKIHIPGERTIAQFSMCLSLLGFLKRFSQSRHAFIPILNYVGQRSLDIYLFHYFFVGSMSLSFLIPILNADNSFSISILLLLPITAFVVILALVVGAFIHSSNILDKFIFFKTK